MNEQVGSEKRQDAVDSSIADQSRLLQIKDAAYLACGLLWMSEFRSEKLSAAYQALQQALGGWAEAVQRAIDAGYEQDHPHEWPYWAGKKRQISDDATVAKVRLTDGLGALPEPRLWYDKDTQQCSGMVPLRPTYKPLWDEDDLRSAVAAERERIAEKFTGVFACCCEAEYTGSDIAKTIRNA